MVEDFIFNFVAESLVALTVFYLLSKACVFVLNC